MKVCRACSYFYEDDDLDMLSCKFCLTIAIEPTVSPPSGCGDIYYKKAIKQAMYRRKFKKTK